MLSIKFYGLGGEGIVTASKVFSRAYSLYENNYAVTIPAYGHERRGAPVNASIIADSSPVLPNCFVYEPDIVLVANPAVIEKGVDIAEGIKESSMLVLNCANENTFSQYARFPFSSIYYVDASKIAFKHLGRDISNSAMLGALAGTGVISFDSVASALADTFSGHSRETNIAAAKEAFDSLKKHSGSLSQTAQPAPSLVEKQKRMPSSKYLLGPVATDFSAVLTGMWRSQRPSVNYSLCRKCGVCSQFCPCDIISIHPEKTECVSFDLNYCKGCGICANECPAECITMKKERRTDDV